MEKLRTMLLTASLLVTGQSAFAQGDPIVACTVTDGRIDYTITTTQSTCGVLDIMHEWMISRRKTIEQCAIEFQPKMSRYTPAVQLCHLAAGGVTTR